MWGDTGSSKYMDVSDPSLLEQGLLTLEHQTIPGVNSGNHQSLSTETSNTQPIADNKLHLSESFIQTQSQHHQRGQVLPDELRARSLQVCVLRSDEDKLPLKQ